MKAPISIRVLSPAEQTGVEAELRSSDAFTLRRCQILLASHPGRALRKSPGTWDVLLEIRA